MHLRKTQRASQQAATAGRPSMLPGVALRSVAQVAVAARGSAAPRSPQMIPYVWSWTLCQSRRLSRTQASAQEAATGSEGAPRVVILGGGFGGLYTAVRLNSLFWPKGKKPQVTLVDQSERFVFKPLLYELLNGTATELEVAPTFTSLLEQYPVRFIQSKVKAAKPDDLLVDGGSAKGGVVELANGHQLPYDWLVVALGAQVDTRGVPGVKEHAVPFNDLPDALKVRETLESIEARGSGSVAVVGAGYAGVELACVIAERLLEKGYAGTTQVTIITPGSGVLEGAGPGQRETAEQALAKLGVRVITGAVLNLDDRPTLTSQARGVAAGVADAAAAAATATAAAASGVAAAASSAAAAIRDPGAAAAVADGAVKAVKGAAAVVTGDPQPTASKAAGAAADATASYASSHSSAASGDQQSGSQYVGPSTLEVDIVLWTAGCSPTTKSEREGFPFPTSSRGSVRTDATLRVLSQQRVFALGDVCMAEQGYVQDSASGSPLPTAEGSSFPATAQVAFQQADYVAWNMWAAMMGRPLLPFRYQHLGSMMSLGAFNAAVDLALPVPSFIQSAVKATPLAPVLNTFGIKLTEPGKPGAAGGLTLEGPLAALARRAAYLYRQPTSQQRMSVAAEWVSQASNIASTAYSSIQRTASTAGSGVPNSTTSA